MWVAIVVSHNQIVFHSAGAIACSISARIRYEKESQWLPDLIEIGHDEPGASYKVDMYIAIYSGGCIEASERQ